MNIYAFTRRYANSGAGVGPDDICAYGVQELTAAAHLFRVTKDKRGKWTARKGETVTEPHKTRLGACLTMSAMLDRAGDR